MQYAGLKLNDSVNCDGGLAVSLWVQGCDFRCKNCQNPQTWDPEGGMPVPTDIKGQIIKAISAHNIKRSFSVLGGEPLNCYNKQFVLDILKAVRKAYPSIRIFLWTGYTLEQLKDTVKTDKVLEEILSIIDVLIDGRYIDEERDITLPLRGSRNQRILYRNVDF